MEFQELIQKRYSCRKFSGRKVEQKLLDQIIEAGRIAPTACNLQPVKIFQLASDRARDAIRSTCSCTFGADSFLLVGCKEEEGWQRCFDQRKFADVDAAIVASHMMLAIEDLGLSTTWVGYFDAPRLQSLLPQLQGYELIALFPIGYAAEDAAPADRHFSRKAADEILETL